MENLKIIQAILENIRFFKSDIVIVFIILLAVITLKIGL
jgi:hypothetical protein